MTIFQVPVISEPSPLRIAAQRCRASGIAVLLKIEKLLSQTHGSMEIIGANEQTIRVLKLSGLGGMLRMSDELNEECEIT